MREFHVVSGFMRTGTSMMMKALEAGGLKPAFNPGRDQMNKTLGDEDYKPNEGGFYELSQSEYQSLDFPYSIPDGINCFKLLFGGICMLPKGNYKMVFMKRDPEEIRQSFEAILPGTVLPQLREYEKLMSKIIGIMEARSDIDIIVLQYTDVIKDPLKCFNKLVEKGWNIDPKKASEIVNPDKYRFRKELLTHGI